jgi:hypothetical protein
MPSCNSSWRICILTADCDRLETSAARQKLLCSATSRKVCINLRFTFTPPPSERPGLAVTALPIPRSKQYRHMKIELPVRIAE